MMNRKILGVVFLIVGLAISGCGSNGGGMTGGGMTGGGMAGGGMMDDSPPALGLGPLNYAAESIPVARTGSVTQASNRGSDEMTTRTTMNIEASYVNEELTFTGTYDNGDGNTATMATASVLSEEDAMRDVNGVRNVVSVGQLVPGTSVQGLLATYKLDDDLLFLAFFTDLQPEDAADADYISIGGWLSAPEAALTGQRAPVGDDFKFGAAADVSNPFPQAGIMGLTGTATYQGEMGGFYTLRSFNGASGFGAVGAVIELMVDFDAGTGGLGTVGGTVSNFRISGDSLTSFSEPEGFPQELTLETADISDMEGGFFTGATSGMDGDGNTYAGQWGGMFAGDAGSNPTSIGGTVGAATEDGSMSFLAAFGAYEQ